MDHHDSRKAHPHQASTDERASSFNPSPGGDSGAPAAPAPQFADPPIVSDCLGDALAERIAETVGETFPPGARKPRHDGFTPEKIGGFLNALAATGVVEHAAAAVGLSASAAYAFRNRRQGRAFARMWDAVLVNRARDRLASELQSRAVAGCVSVRKRDGVVVGEYHYYDNRLAMALLTRLDRLAEKEAPVEAHLRALSEDLEEFVECVAEGGDQDAFVEARRPAPPQPPREDDDPGLTRFADMTGCRDYLNVDPMDIPVADIDLSAMRDWGADQIVRAFRSGFMSWLDIDQEVRPDAPRDLGRTLQFDLERKAVCAAMELFAGDDDPSEEERAAIPIDDLDLFEHRRWTQEQLARAWRSGLISAMPDDFWDDYAEEMGSRRAQE